MDLHRHLGAHTLAGDRTGFLVWAPQANKVEVVLVDQDRRILLDRNGEGYFLAVVERCGAGERYMFSVNGGEPRCDPASRYQPLGVHGPSEIINESFQWSDQDWQPPKAESLVIYELHVGAFTEKGSFLSAIDRLDELVELGITAIEMMPLAESAGRWNWGYDGVGFFAPNHNYGSPYDLKMLVDAAHQKGLAVIVDVVYNHFGPEGNYLGEFAPYFSTKHATPWGDAPNFDDAQFGVDVRRFFISNAIYWLDEYHIDGLRVDAVHCTRDDSPVHIIAEMNEQIHGWSKASKRKTILIAESNVYDPEMTQLLNDGGIGFDAMWCDDFLHSVFATVRPGEQLSNRTYYPNTDLSQTLSQGYVYEGSLSQLHFRSDPTRFGPGSRQRVQSNELVYSIQNHDFIGNHPLAKRLHQLTSHETQRAAAALLLLSPAIPMLFMGEEFASENPFLFFVDFGDEAMRKQVVEGRHREYPQHDWSAGTLPIEPMAFESSKIGPRDQGDMQTWDWYRSLIQLRKAWCESGLLCDANLETEYRPENNVFALRYCRDDTVASVVTRFSPSVLDSTAAFGSPVPISPIGEMIYDSRPGASAPDGLLLNHAKVYIQNGSSRNSVVGEFGGQGI
ncbi:Malto-oligosyltrehalose trehalohydrolase [Novipirellula aureliae]|uniref:Malto-oligosyltrehalose trehalohydrolase n=2 Tax=Novipirellula aureliae TaxID=2527966 RepID=A0A5C6E9T3_9BACT|nr:Malto-oligosyltrehalose trehalohydrolase [Novipirellula aureliae]